MTQNSGIFKYDKVTIAKSMHKTKLYLLIYGNFMNYTLAAVFFPCSYVLITIEFFIQTILLESTLLIILKISLSEQSIQTGTSTGLLC